MEIPLFFVAAALLISSVFAKPSFYITSPTAGSAFHPGDSIQIRWQNGDEDGAVIQLLSGSDINTAKPTGYGFKISDGTDGGATWTIPSNVAPGSYSLQFTYNNDEGATAYSYSPAFNILDGNSGVGSSGTTSGAASGAGSGAASGGSTGTGSTTAPISQNVPPVGSQSPVGTQPSNAPPMGGIAPNNVFEVHGSGATSTFSWKGSKVLAPILLGIAIFWLFPGIH